MQNDQWTQTLITDAVLAYSKEQKNKRWWNIIKWLMIFSIIIFVSQQYNSPQKQSMAKINAETKDHIAMIKISGCIGCKDNNDDALIQQIKNAFENEKSKGVLFIINSPGGSPFSAETIHETIMHQKSKYPEKFVHVLAENVCASAAYWIACAADKIISTPSTLVGSIGVLMPNYNFSELAKKAGVEDRTIMTGELKYASDIKEMSPNYLKMSERILNQTFNLFKNVVKSGRNEKITNEEAAFSGGIWIAQDALELGLVDQVGTLLQMQEEFQELEFINYAPKADFNKILKELLEDSMASAKSVSHILSKTESIISHSTY